MAFCWKLCGNMKVIAVCLLLLFFIIIEADENNCTVQKSKTGETIVFNAFNNGEYHCMWKTNNPYTNRKVNCNIDIPSNSAQICTEGSISVQSDGKNIGPYCGYGTFNFEGTDVIIKFDLPYNSKGNFTCTEKLDEYNCNCGWKKVTRIVGGEETGVNEYPMMAGLVDINNHIIYCGSTIIYENYILTAAHCVDGKDVTKLAVVVGEHDVNTGKETNATKVFHISKCEIHPSYNNFDNDIAVCQIIGTIKYNAEVGPVCLPFQHRYDSFGGDIVTTLGWGLTSFGGKKATKLQKVNLNVINPEDCKKKEPKVTNGNICTYTPGKDSCQMDSGGPVLWQNPTTGNVIVVGITSAGSACASDQPAINTRTGGYMNWIQSMTPDAQYCKIE